MAVTHLTTAMASNRGTDFVNANGGVTGTNITGTIFSNGLSLSVANPGAGGGAAISGDANSQNTGTVNFSNSNGVSFGLSNNGVMTASHNGLTAQSAYVFSNSNGVSFGTNGSTVTATVATNYQSAGAYLTTAMLSNAATISNINVSGGTTSSNMSGINFVNSNGVSWSLDTASKVYATVKTDYQTAGAYLTTARASNDAIGLNSALTANGVSVTANSSGLSLNFPAFLTTAMASNRGTDFVQANAAFAGTNASGTIASNGISVSVAAPGAGGGIGIAAGTRTATTANTLLFDNANGVTFGLNVVGGSIMTASHNAITTGALSDHSHGNPTLALTNLTGTTASASNGFTLSLSAAAPGGGAANTFYSTKIGGENMWAQSSSTLPNNSLYIQPHNLQANLSAIAVKIPIMMTNSSLASSSGAVAYTANFGIYTTNATNSTILSLHYSTSYTMYFSNSSNASRAYSVITGIGNSTSYNTVSSSSAGLNLSSNIHGARELLMPISSLLSPGAYWFAFRQSTALSGTSNSVMAMSHIIWSSQTQAGWHVATSATSAGGIAKNIGLGTYSATTGAMPNGISLTQINKAATQPVFYIVNATS